MTTTIQPGTWKIRAVAGRLGHTRGGAAQLGVEVAILDGPSAGQHATWYGGFGENQFDRTVESLRALGWQGDDLSDLVGLGDAEAYGVFEQEEYEGKTFVRCKWVNALGGVAIKDAMSDVQAKAFAAEMRGRIMAMRSGGGGQRFAGAPGSAGSRASTSPDDDIPF